MEIYAYRLGSLVCRQIHFSFTPCSTSDARELLGYCLVLMGIAGFITAYFYGANRPMGR
jgi:hypothetical protein